MAMFNSYVCLPEGNYTILYSSWMMMVCLRTDIDVMPQSCHQKMQKNHRYCWSEPLGLYM